MSLVDAGRVGIGDVLAGALPDFRGDKAHISYRHAYAHTSGLPAQSPCLGDTDSTLQLCAESIAHAASDGPAGSAFAYGGSSMQAAGAAVEVLVDSGYEAWFQQALALPLGAKTLAHDAFGVTDNPRVAGGAQGTVLDYAPFLIALLDHGAVAGRQVLSTEAVWTLLDEQTGGAPIASSPFPEALGYGLGCWVESVGADGNPSLLSSPGAFGAYPWIDLERGYCAFVLIRRGLQDGEAIVAAIRPLVAALADEG